MKEKKSNPNRSILLYIVKGNYHNIIINMIC